jgi:hypothetical protein
MPTNKSAVLRLLAFLTVFLLPSCVDKPLSDPDKAKPDERLYGTWKAVGKQFSPLRYEIVCIGKSSQEGAPAGIMSFVDVENDPQDRLRVRGPTSFFTTSVGKATYANLCMEDLELGPLVSRSAARWDKGKIKAYALLKYLVEADKLTVRSLSADAAEEAIKKGNVKGTVERKGFLKLRELRLDGAEGLRSYLLKGGDEVLFPNKEELTGVFTRVK